jgi:hypothetical protein
MPRRELVIFRKSPLGGKESDEEVDLLLHLQHASSLAFIGKRNLAQSIVRWRFDVGHEFRLEIEQQFASQRLICIVHPFRAERRIKIETSLRPTSGD